MYNIKTSFIATTATGIFLHFVGIDYFPEKLFSHRDEGQCHVYYYKDPEQNSIFWLEVVGDENHSRFYFTPPKSLDKAALYGGSSVLYEKETIFKVLNVNIRIRGITRNLILRLDTDWLDAARNNI